MTEQRWWFGWVWSLQAPIGCHESHYSMVWWFPQRASHQQHWLEQQQGAGMMWVLNTSHVQWCNYYHDYFWILHVCPSSYEMVMECYYCTPETAWRKGIMKSLHVMGGNHRGRKQEVKKVASLGHDFIFNMENYMKRLGWGYQVRRRVRQI